MNVWKRLKKLFGHEQSVPLPPLAMPDDEPEIVVPEITVDQLKTALSENNPPLVIDVREPYEWRLVRMPGALHIPMNDVPTQVENLPCDRSIVVMCAHGSRSYGVAAWLVEQGFDAASLEGGITQWARQGGSVEQTLPE